LQVSLEFFNTDIFVGGFNSIDVIHSDSTVSRYDDICSSGGSLSHLSPIQSFIIYQSKYIAVACLNELKVTILNIDLSQTGTSYKTSSGEPLYMAFDGRRFLVTTFNPASIDIFQ
jgi:hypothetical protein